MGTTEKKSFKALRLKEITFSDFKALSFKRTNPQNAHVTKRNRNHYTAQLAQNKAAYLCQKLNSPQNENFYLKCAWNLTDAYIDDLLVRAMGKMNPTRYFVSAASREMRSNN